MIMRVEHTLRKIGMSCWRMPVQIIFIVSLFASSSALADDLSTCVYGSVAHRPHVQASAETIIFACTRAIDSKRFRGVDLTSIYFSRGLAYLMNGDIDRTISDYDWAIKLDPTVALSFYNRSRAYLNKGDIDHAIADADQVIKLSPKPKSAADYLTRGDAYSLKGEPDRAISDYDIAIKLSPKDSDAFAARGNAYGVKGELDRAIADYDQAIKINSKNSTVVLFRGLALHFKGEDSRAVADLDRFIELNSNPKSSIDFTNRGDAFSYKGEYARAISEYDQAIKVNPNHITFTGRGHARLLLKQLDQALGDLNEAIRLAPKNPEARALRGRVWEAKGDANSALADYSAALTSIRVDLSDYQAQEMARQRLAAISPAAKEDSAGARELSRDSFQEIATRTVRLHVTGTPFDGAKVVNEWGTGFFIDSNHIVTAGHVFGDVDWSLFIDGRENLPKIDIELPNGNNLLSPIPNQNSGARLVGQNRLLDLALIRVAGDFASVRCVEADIKSSALRPFRALGWRANRSGYDTLVQPSEGDVRMAPPEDGDQRLRFTIMAASEGNSGGPIFNKSGNVIAIITSGRNRRLEPGQTETFGTPIQSIKNAFSGYNLDSCFKSK